MYYFYGLMKFCSKPKILALLLIIGSVAAIIFVPWGLGNLLVPTEEVPWVLGMLFIIIGAIAIAISVGIYCLVVEQIQKWQR